MKKAFILFIVSLSLLGCAKIKYGNVIEKWYEPESESLMILPMIMSTGKSTTTMMIPYFVHDNEDWVIKVRGISENGDTIIRNLYVSKEQYDTLNVGKFICFDGMCDEDTNNIKTKK